MQTKVSEVSEGEIDGDAPVTMPCGCHLPRSGIAILCDEHEAETNAMCEEMEADDDL